MAARNHQNNLLTTVGLAKRLGVDDVLHVTAQAITGWVGRAGYPQPVKASQRPGQPHQWRYSDVLRWVAEGSPEPHDERALRARKLAADARKAEIEVRKLEGALLERHEVERTWFEKARLIRDGLLNIPDRVSPLLASISDPHKVHQLLDSELRKALNDIADAVTVN